MYYPKKTWKTSASCAGSVDSQCFLNIDGFPGSAGATLKGESTECILHAAALHEVRFVEAHSGSQWKGQAGAGFSVAGLRGY